MGSEYPKKGDRRHTSGQLRNISGITKSQSRKSLSSTSGGEVASNKLPKTALTPISRLKKFQKLRDRNLRTQVLARNNFKKQLKMLESVPAQSSDIAFQSMEDPASVLKEMMKMENGSENGLNGIPEEEETQDRRSNGVENGMPKEDQQVRRSPRKTKEEAPAEEQDLIWEVMEDEEINVEDVEEDIDEVALAVRSSPRRSTQRRSETKELEVDVKVFGTPKRESRRSSPRKYADSAEGSSSNSSPKPQLYTSARENYDADSYSWRNESLRITGRRPIRNMSPVKRKSEGFDEEPASKRFAYTPSISSPGWRFLSPFSLFKRSVPDKPIDDSMLVNVSTDSAESTDLNLTADPEEDAPLETSVSEHQVICDEDIDVENIERPTAEPPSKPSWLCSIM